VNNAAREIHKPGKGLYRAALHTLHFLIQGTFFQLLEARGRKFSEAAASALHGSQINGDAQRLEAMGMHQS
jgi:hypothetical protein